MCEWLKEGGGIVGHEHPPAYRFNAGQKMIYWIVVLGGGAVAASGYLLMFPFYGTDIAGMQIAQIVHGVVAVLFVAAMLGHIYIGTIGMEGAVRGDVGRHRRRQLGEGAPQPVARGASWPKAAPARRRRKAGCRLPNSGAIADRGLQGPASAGRFFHRDACEPVQLPGALKSLAFSPLGSFGQNAIWPVACVKQPKRGGAHGCYTIAPCASSAWPAGAAPAKPRSSPRSFPASRRGGSGYRRVKHAHHAFDVDLPGKDSHTHRMAGATEVLVGSANRWALVHELRGEAEPALARCSRRLSPVDLVLVEGYKRERHPKLEVYRAAIGKPLLHPDDPAIVAIASDQPLPAARVPVVDLDDVERIVDILLRHAVPLDALLASVGHG